MAYYVVVGDQGPAWLDSVPMREQEDWDGHAKFMNALVDDGFVVLGGPIGDGTPDIAHSSSSSRVSNKKFVIGSHATPGRKWVCW